MDTNSKPTPPKPTHRLERVYIAGLINVVDDEQWYPLNPFMHLGTINTLRRALGESAGAVMWMSGVEHNNN